MAKSVNYRDPLKEESKEQRGSIAKLIVDTRNAQLSNNGKETIIAALLAEKQQTQNLKGIVCPYQNFPDGEVKERFMKVWNSLKTDEEKKQMRDTIGISDDGKLNIIPMKKKFSLLTAEHNGKDIFAGTHTDRLEQQGVFGVTYFTGRAAEEECEKQGKKLLNTKKEVDKFISHFPGENEEERIRNFVTVMGLEKSGCLKDSNLWSSIGYNGFARLSKVQQYGTVYEATWNNEKAYIKGGQQKWAKPVVVSEDC